MTSVSVLEMINSLNKIDLSDFQIRGDNEYFGPAIINALSLLIVKKKGKLYVLAIPLFISVVALVCDNNLNKRLG